MTLPSAPLLQAHAEAADPLADCRAERPADPHTPVVADFAADLACMESAFLAHNTECLRQLQAAHADLARLQSLLDEAMNSLGASFTQLAPALADLDGATGTTASLAVTTLQYQDICTQLVGHLHERLAHAGELIDGMQPPLSQALAGVQGDHAARTAVLTHVEDMRAALAGARTRARDNPVRHDSLEPGDVELF